MNTGAIINRKSLTRLIGHLAYIRKGNGSTREMLVVQLKEKTIENIEACDLAIKSIYPKVSGGFGLWYIEQ